MAHGKAASDREVPVQDEHGLHELTPIPPAPTGQRVIDAWWVNTFTAYGTYKSRLVVQRWSQVPTISRGRTFARVWRLKTIRMILVIPAELDYEMFMLDVQTKFLNTDVEQDVFAETAPAYGTTDKSGVSLLVMTPKKSLYGLGRARIFSSARLTTTSLKSSPFPPNRTHVFTYSRLTLP